MTQGRQPPVRIVVVDDHPIVRKGITATLEREPGFTVVGEAENAADGYRLVREANPDLVIIDLALPGASGLELVTHVAARGLPTRMLVMSMHHYDDFASTAFRAGAHGYVMKDEAPAHIVEAVRALLAGLRYPPQEPAKRAAPPAASRREKIKTLTPGELEVLRMLGQGMTTRAMAGHLRKSPKTVELYRANIRRKLDIKSANELITFASRWLSDIESASARR